VRHADRPTVEEHIGVAATPDRIWPLVSDITLPVGISDELVAVEWTSGVSDAPGVGRTFVGTNSNQYFGRWQTTATVTECDEPSVFGWIVGELDNPNTSWRYTLLATEAGTRVTQWVQLGTGPSGLVIAIARMPDKEEPIVARRLDEFRAAMRRNLETIKQRAEAGA
jgi:hypothetical protein